MRSFLVALAAFVLPAGAAASAATVPLPALVPRPDVVAAAGCAAPVVLDRALRFPAGVDPGGLEIVRERWQALGIAPPVVAARDPDVSIVAQTDAYAAPTRGGYDLMIRAVSGKPRAQSMKVELRASDPDGRFNALATLAQLPVRDGSRWVLPCVAIHDAPAMPWRVVSDDVSRGPFPTMRYARERIRTLASLKINGWSPYMEMVLADPRYPFVAWPNGWTVTQLRELSVYARRFHVTLIPEQQTFAHMHESLKWEQLAPLAELPHGYLLADSDSRTYAYLAPLVKNAAAATGSPFVHIGSDEPVDLGRGRTPRSAQTFAGHVTRVAAFLAGTNARPMIWDDAVQQDKTIFPLLPKSTVIVTWHYGAEKTFRPYIDAIANAGFDQFVAPGASNWNEIYPDLSTAYANIGRMLADGKSAARARPAGAAAPAVLGMFMTVWHDDGETLYEATWPALAYAAASAWQREPVDDARWHATFARAFFGSDDARYAQDLDALQAIRSSLRTTPGDPIDYTFWRDPFDSSVQARAASLDLAGVRNRAETVLQHLWNAAPPLHAAAAAVMRLGALRYDQLARRLQIGKEARDYYDDARAHASRPGQAQVYRSLGVAKYLCWELRDAQANADPLYAAAWRYESTEPGLERFMTHARNAEADAQRCADRIDGVMREDYLRRSVVPPWDDVMGAQATPGPATARGSGAAQTRTIHGT